MYASFFGSLSAENTHVKMNAASAFSEYSTCNIRFDQNKFSGEGGTLRRPTSTTPSPVLRIQHLRL